MHWVFNTKAWVRLHFRPNQGEPHEICAVTFRTSNKPKQAVYLHFISVPGVTKFLLQLLDSQTWRKWLLQFISLLFVLDDKGIEISTASHLELNCILDLLYLHRFGILSPCCNKKILNFVDLLRHCEMDVTARYLSGQVKFSFIEKPGVICEGLLIVTPWGILLQSVIFKYSVSFHSALFHK